MTCSSSSSSSTGRKARHGIVSKGIQDTKFLHHHGRRRQHFVLLFYRHMHGRKRKGCFRIQHGQSVVTTALPFLLLFFHGLPNAKISSFSHPVLFGRSFHFWVATTPKGSRQESSQHHGTLAPHTAGDTAATTTGDMIGIGIGMILSWNVTPCSSSIIGSSPTSRRSLSIIIGRFRKDILVVVGNTVLTGRSSSSSSSSSSIMRMIRRGQNAGNVSPDTAVGTCGCFWLSLTMTITIALLLLWLWTALFALGVFFHHGRKRRRPRSTTLSVVVGQW